MTAEELIAFRKMVPELKSCVEQARSTISNIELLAEDWTANLAALDAGKITAEDLPDLQICHQDIDDYVSESMDNADDLDTICRELGKAAEEL